MIKVNLKEITLIILFCLFRIIPLYSQEVKQLPAYVKMQRANLNAKELEQRKKMNDYVSLRMTQQERMRLSKIPEMSHVLIMPIFSMGRSQLSGGIMVGYMKRTGGYLKVKSGFSDAATDKGLACDREGMFVNSDDPRLEGKIPWYTGETKKSRFDVTAGLLQRIAKPLYLYAGVGYGSRTLAWETVEQEWLKNKNFSFNGVEVEIGGVLALGHFVVSLGVQTNSFQYMEGNMGIGVLF